MTTPSCFESCGNCVNPEGLKRANEDVSILIDGLGKIMETFDGMADSVEKLRTEHAEEASLVPLHELARRDQMLELAEQSTGDVASIAFILDSTYNDLVTQVNGIDCSSAYEPECPRLLRIGQGYGDLSQILLGDASRIAEYRAQSEKFKNPE